MSIVVFSAASCLTLRLAPDCAHLTLNSERLCRVKGCLLPRDRRPGVTLVLSYPPEGDSTRVALYGWSSGPDTDAGWSSGPCASGVRPGSGGDDTALLQVSVTMKPGASDPGYGRVRVRSRLVSTRTLRAEGISVESGEVLSRLTRVARWLRAQAGLFVRLWNAD